MCECLCVHQLMLLCAVHLSHRFTADVRSVLSRNLHQHRLWWWTSRHGGWGGEGVQRGRWMGGLPRLYSTIILFLPSLRVSLFSSHPAWLMTHPAHSLSLTADLWPCQESPVLGVHGDHRQTHKAGFMGVGEANPGIYFVLFLCFSPPFFPLFVTFKGVPALQVSGYRLVCKKTVWPHGRVRLSIDLLTYIFFLCACLSYCLATLCGRTDAGRGGQEIFFIIMHLLILPPFFFFFGVKVLLC